MKVCVLGAGVVGTTTAYFLQKNGHEVTVIDRQSGAGLETSFANGGQISASHAAPWAGPQVREALGVVADDETLYEACNALQRPSLIRVEADELRVREISQLRARGGGDPRAPRPQPPLGDHLVRHDVTAIWFAQ